MQAHPDYHKRYRYNITGESFNKQMEAQNRSCAICKVPFSDKIKPCLDHCHLSSKVRGILCNRCNSGLGMFQDRPEFCRAAADYLEGLGVVPEHLYSQADGYSGE